MKPAAQLTKPASLPKTGLFATLRGLPAAQGTGARSGAAPAGPGLTIARRLGLAALACVCALACLTVAHPASAAAATPFEFGSFGEEARQVHLPTGVVANSAGDVYVGDTENRRVDKYDKNGNFLLAWGDGVIDGSHELQTCTVLTECRKGIERSTPDAFAFPTGVAVDNNPSSTSFGDVYVIDFARARVVKFDPNGKFLLTFGGHVNAATGANVCAAGEECNEEGTRGTEDGAFSTFPISSVIAVGPGGAVYVGDTARVQVFDSTGAWRKNISLAGLSAEGLPTALAVDPSGDVFVADGGVEGVHEFELPSGLEALAQFDIGSTSITSLATDAAGHVYVGDSNGGFHVQQYDPTATELASFGANTVSGSNAGLAFSNATGELYATDAGSEEKEGVWVFSAPPPGPLIEGETAAPAPKGAATLRAQVNPEGNETTYHFEYVAQTRFAESGYASATSTPPATIGLEPNLDERFGEEPVEAKLAGATLIPGETYHWRVVATDSLAHATTGADQAFEETPAALITGPSAANVDSTSATLAARIDPLGANTSYRLEYGTSTSYDHVLGGSVGEGTEFVPISYHVQELAPGTAYHYRLVTISEVGVVHGADHTFTTQAAPRLALPDGRAWELVSPASTGGSVMQLLPTRRQAASDGGAITYPVSGAPLGENVESSVTTGIFQILSQRGQEGWQHRPANVPEGAGGTQDIDALASPAGEEGEPNQHILGSGSFSLFSPDLTSAAYHPAAFTSLSSEGLAGTGYLRDNANGSYTPLLTAANTPPGTELLAVEPPKVNKTPQVFTLGGDPDHVILGSPLKLTAEAIPTGQVINRGGVGNLYEWSGGRLQLVNILPDGKPTCFGEAGVGCDLTSVNIAGENVRGGTVARAVSSDGRRVAWTRGDPYFDSNNYRGLYVRDMVEGRTVQLGGHGARYQTMSSDGSRVFFLEGGDLYEYTGGTPYDAGTLIDLTADHGPGEVSAGVQESVADVSKDGSSVYFVAKGILSNTESSMHEKAVLGADNLYLLHETGGKWSTSFIATLSRDDEHTWGTQRAGAPMLRKVASRVSPDGRYLAFMSERSLTGYDNVDINEEATEEEVNGAMVTTTEHHDEEVYLYDSTTGHLACASCDPTGARPTGLFTGANKGGLVEREGPWAEAGHPHWLAGSLPGWEQHGAAETTYQPRYLSNGGRLFFDSPEGLVPQDTNGLEDVYQYEPASVGSCTDASATFSERSGGCVGLISSGTSSVESGFVDASESGNDVFFLSSQKLTAADQDTGYDMWDAHVCSASSPCPSAPVSPPPCTSGDSCKAAPSPQPELFGSAPSATFSGAGNTAPSPRAASKPLTRAQKRARALSSCRKKYKKSKKRRAACERKAHKQYGYAAKRSRNANTSKRGGK